MKKYYFNKDLLNLAKLDNTKSYNKKELFSNLLKIKILKLSRNKIFFKKSVGIILGLDQVIIKRRYMDFSVYYNYINNMIISQDCDIFEFPLQLKDSDINDLDELIIEM